MIFIDHVIDRTKAVTQHFLENTHIFGNRYFIDDVAKRIEGSLD